MLLSLEWRRASLVRIAVAVTASSSSSFEPPSAALAMPCGTATSEFSATIARNAKMNHGSEIRRHHVTLAAPGSAIITLINATIGASKATRANLTTVAWAPAASEKA